MAVMGSLFSCLQQPWVFIWNKQFGRMVMDDRYLSYLRTMLHGKVDFMLTKDLVAHPEGTVAKKGDIVNKEKYHELSQLNLNIALDRCIKIAKPLTQASIYQTIGKLVSQDPSFQEIDENFGKASLLDQCCDTLKRYPDLLEILTVFKFEAEDLFNQSLLSAYLAYITGVAAKYSQAKIESAFLAGLLHDIGLLFIHRNYLDKKKRLTAQEWKNIQLHPIIAFKLLKDIDGFSAVSRKAILDHHERPDGTGYPMGKKEDRISELGSLISLLDDVIVVYNKQFKPFKRTIKNLFPIIQMNTFGYHQSAVTAMINILKQSKNQAVENIDKETVKELINYTYQQQLYINKIVDVIKQINDIIGFSHNSKRVTAIQNIGGKITSVIASSGLQESSYIELLQRLTTEDHKELHLEIEETRLMLEEVIFQLQSYYKAANLFSTRSSSGLAEKIGIFTDIFSATERPPVPASVAQYWGFLSSK
jgi:HD-GYP domain-containing protein (c-di-GMP phosphodiesterase class II)